MFRQQDATRLRLTVKRGAPDRRFFATRCIPAADRLSRCQIADLGCSARRVRSQFNTPSRQNSWRRCRANVKWRLMRSFGMPTPGRTDRLKCPECGLKCGMRVYSVSRDSPIRSATAASRSSYVCRSEFCPSENVRSHVRTKPRTNQIRLYTISFTSALRDSM